MSSTESSRTAVFRADVFEVATLEQAKRLIVTPEAGTTTEERWEKETAWLVEDIARFLPIGRGSRVLDFGCGVGRLAKELIDRHACRVFGIDNSKAMQLFAPGYVLSEDFVVWSPEVLQQMVERGFRADFAISLWVIQHVFDANDAIERIYRALAPGGLCYVLNSQIRCVPTDLGWVNDGFDVQAALRRKFTEIESHNLPETATTRQLAETTVIQVLRKPDEA